MATATGHDVRVRSAPTQNTPQSPLPADAAPAPALAARAPREVMAIQCAHGAAFLMGGTGFLLYAVEPILVAQGVPQATIQTAIKGLVIGGCLAGGAFLGLLARKLSADLR